MAKYALRKTNNSAAFKITDTQTISLAVDCLLTGKESAVSPVCNISRFLWSGAAASTITVTRNSVKILDIAASAGCNLDFSQCEFNDNVENTKDIVVTITGNAQLYIVLKKQSGYNTFIETEQYSVYDDETKIGPKT